LHSDSREKDTAMWASNRAGSGHSSLGSEPDFLEFLRCQLNADAQEVTALLGRWLVEYQPRTAHEIRVLEPRTPRSNLEAWP